MKVLTLEILRGRFLPPNTFSLLLKAVSIIASRQWVKRFLKTQLCFCRLILNRRKAHSAVVPWPVMAWECLPVVGQQGRGWLCVILSKRWADSNPFISTLCVKNTAQNKCQLCSSFDFTLCSSHLHFYPICSSQLQGLHSSYLVEATWPHWLSAEGDEKLFQKCQVFRLADCLSE